MSATRVIRVRGNVDLGIDLEGDDGFLQMSYDPKEARAVVEAWEDVRRARQPRPSKPASRITEELEKCIAAADKLMPKVPAPTPRCEQLVWVLGPASSLHRIPWERACRAWIGADRPVPVLRTLEWPLRESPHPAPGPNLRILYSGVAVDAWSEGPLGLLDVWGERVALATAAGASGADVYEAMDGTLDALAQACVFQPHVVHISTHGVNGRLAMEAADGTAQSIAGTDLLTRLRGAPSLRGFVLSACQSARPGDDDLAAVAHTVAEASYWALGMLHTVTEADARSLTKTFHEQLGQHGKPTLALAAARGGLVHEPPTPDPLAWSAPVLYLGAKECPAFDRNEEVENLPKVTRPRLDSLERKIDTDQFLGRRRERRQLIAHLRRHDAWGAGIHAVGGAGKSALAAHVAKVLAVSGDGWSVLKPLVGKMVNAQALRASTARNSQRRRLLILDDLERAGWGEAEQEALDEILEEQPNLRILATMIEPPAAWRKQESGWLSVYLPPLPAGEVALLLGRTGRFGGSQDIAELIDAIKGHAAAAIEVAENPNDPEAVAQATIAKRARPGSRLKGLDKAERSLAWALAQAPIPLSQIVLPKLLKHLELDGGAPERLGERGVLYALQGQGPPRWALPEVLRDAVEAIGTPTDAKALRHRLAEALRASRINLNQYSARSLEAEWKWWLEASEGTLTCSTTPRKRVIS